MTWSDNFRVAGRPHRRLGLTFVAAAAVGFMAGCASRQPLPKRAAMETGVGLTPAIDFRGNIDEADIVYFPSERAASGAQSEPAAQVIEAFRTSGVSFAIGWELIDVKDQPVLDQLSSQAASARQRSISRLELAGGGRAREHCRSVLNDPRLAPVHHIALRASESAPESGPIENAAAPPHQPQPGMHFKPAPGGFEDFAARMTAAETLNGSDLATAYAARVRAQQFAAEQIVRHFQSGAGGKLLVFLRSADLENGQGVPFYVAQKLSLRQLVLGPHLERSSATRLLTGASAGGRRFEVVDGAPAAAGHR